MGSISPPQRHDHPARPEGLHPAILWATIHEVIGATLKHYKIESQLGQGGMGVVYRARDERLQRAVALKLLPEELSVDADRKRRFLQEARAACAVNHPAIAQIYDVDEQDGSIFIAMELVEGRTLRELIAAKELDVLGAIEIARQVADGLAKAHDAGIVHRDIRPENVMVTGDGHAKLLDFGLAKLTEQTSPGDSSADQLSHMETMAKTQAGMVMGTLRYMSPEQARGQRVDLRSDIFSLGVVLYEMVTRQLPFSGNTPLDTLHAIAFEETRPVTQMRPNLPPSLQRCVSRCLRKKAADRYASARDLSAELKTVQREIESGVSSPVPVWRRLQDELSHLRQLEPREWAQPTVVAAVVGVGLLVLFLTQDDAIPLLIIFGTAGLYIYRRARNRGARLLRRFTGVVKKLPEVKVVAVDERRISVLAERAVAKTYVRANAALDGINAKLFFGEPFTMVVRDDLPEDELRQRLTRPGILHVREDE